VVLETLMGLVADEVEGVVQQVGQSQSLLLLLLQGSVGVPEDQGDVDVSRTQHLQALDRVGIDEVQLDSRVRPGQLGSCPRYEGAEDRLETGESYPSGMKSHAGGQLDGCGVYSPQDLCRPPSQQLPFGSESDSAAHSLDELGPGGGFQPPQVVTDRWLGVMQLLRGFGHRSMAGDRLQHLELD
jgi:hypothetical protein